MQIWELPPAPTLTKIPYLILSQGYFIKCDGEDEYNYTKVQRSNLTKNLLFVQLIAKIQIKTSKTQQIIRLTGIEQMSQSIPLSLQA